MRALWILNSRLTMVPSNPPNVFETGSSMSKRKEEMTAPFLGAHAEYVLWSGMLAVISDMQCVGCLFTQKTSQSDRLTFDPLAKFTNGHILPHAARRWPIAKQSEIIASLA